MLNVEIYATKKVLKNKILSKFPALISKTIIKYDQLSDFQRKNLKNNYKSTEKLLSHLGYDKNSYISFEMYESLGYRINIKKILEYKHTNFMKPYIDFLFEKKSYYKRVSNVCMPNTFMILANSLFGVMMTRVERFKNYKIVTTEDQVDKKTNKPNFISRNTINENLAILEMEKLSAVYSYPILIGSVILQNSKVHKDDYKVSYMDTDSIYAKLNITHEEYIKILENNKDLFGSNIGNIEPEYLDNPIQEGIFLSSKCYSYIYKNDIPKNEHKMKNNVLHTKGISDSYSKQYIDHNLFKQTLLNNDKLNKISFNTISVKNQKISTNKVKKNNIEFLNDKRYIKNIKSNIPHTFHIE